MTRCIATMAALLAFRAMAAPAYRLVDLGALGGRIGSEARAVNNKGEVVGSTAVILEAPAQPYAWPKVADQGLEQAFLWRNGHFTLLKPPRYNSSSAVGINDRGLIVGTSQGWMMSWWWKDGKTRDLALQPDNTLSPYYLWARGVNDRGQVVGAARLWENGLSRALVLGDDQNRRSPPLMAAANNDSGLVVGSRTTGDLPVAILCESGAVRELVGFGGRSQALDINNEGVVVGVAATPNGPNQPVVWRGGRISALPLPRGCKSGTAVALNNSGDIVGSAPEDLALPHRAMLWRGGEVIDLNTVLPKASEWTLTNANDINDKGWIVGKGTIGDGGFRAFLLIPTQDAATAGAGAP